MRGEDDTPLVLRASRVLDSCVVRSISEPEQGEENLLPCRIGGTVLSETSVVDEVVIQFLRN